MLDPPRVPSSVVALTVAAAVAACAIFVGGLVAWPLLVAGVLVLIAALAALWVIQRRRDHTLW
jgi:membrane protein YdbS with pleckstrin-like domain